MTLRHLRIFLAVCENGCNVTKAAKALGMAQPAVSLALRELDDYYGVALFDRINRRLHITEAGRLFQQYASSIRLLSDDMDAGMRNWDAFGVLRVGSSISIGQQLLSAYVKAYAQLRPGIDVRVCVDNSGAIENMILHNSLDVALIEGVVHSPEVVGEAFLEDNLALVCGAELLLPRAGPQDLVWFSRQRFLLRERGSGTRDLFDEVTSQAGLILRPSWESTDSAVLLNAAAAGLGIAALPYRLVREAVAKGQVQVVEAEGLRFHRQLRIIYHRHKLLTPSVKDFISLCREYGDV